MARQRGKDDEASKARRDEVEALRELTAELAVVGKAFAAPSVVPAQVRQQAGLNARIGAAFTPGPPVVTPISPRPSPPVAQLVNPQMAASPTIPIVRPVEQPGGAPGAAGAVSSLGSLVSSLTGPVGIATAAFTGAAVAIGSFVQKANPAALERFQVILDDVAGVIGQTLTPVIEVLGEGFRLFGDVLASILPGADELREALAPISDFLKDLRDALGPLVPIIKDTLAVGLKLLGQALRVVLVPLGELAKLLGSFFGIQEATPLKSSQGAAARNISFTNPEQFAKSVNVAAFRGAAGAGEYHGPLNKIGGTLGQISATTTSILGQMGGKGGGFVGNVRAGASLFTGEADREMGRIYKQGVEANKWMDLNTARMHHREVAERVAGGDTRGSTAAELREAAAEMRAAAKRLGLSERDTSAELQRHLDQSKRRAMDGHPGSA